MKMKSSLLLVLFAALLALASGCSTVKTVDVVNGCFPKNTLVIRNYTPYNLMVYRNGVPWTHERYWHGKMYYPPTVVGPHKTIPLYQVASNQTEHVVLGLRAVKVIRMGCLIDDVAIGSCRRVVNLGTENPPRFIVVRRWNFW